MREKLGEIAAAFDRAGEANNTARRLFDRIFGGCLERLLSQAHRSGLFQPRISPFQRRVRNCSRGNPSTPSSRVGALPRWITMARDSLRSVRRERSDLPKSERHTVDVFISIPMLLAPRCQLLRICVSATRVDSHILLTCSTGSPAPKPLMSLT